jgi:hypothetical protein
VEYGGFSFFFSTNVSPDSPRSIVIRNFMALSHVFGTKFGRSVTATAYNFGNELTNLKWACEN